MRASLAMHSFSLTAKTLHSRAVLTIDPTMGIHRASHVPLRRQIPIFMGGIMNLTSGDWITGLA